MKLFCSLATTALISASFIVHSHANADDYRPCSFNHQVIACKLNLISGGFRITWRDGKRMTYLGTSRNNSYLTDSLGGVWHYVDFDTGKSFTLTNSKNRNVIIWNGTYREYGRYVGL